MYNSVKGRRYAVFTKVRYAMDVDCTAKDALLLKERWRSPSNMQFLESKKAPLPEVKIKRRRKKKPNIFIAIFTNPFYVAKPPFDVNRFVGQTLIGQLSIPLMIIGLSGPPKVRKESNRRVSFPAKISSTRRFSKISSTKVDDDESESSEDSKGSESLVFIIINLQMKICSTK